MAPTQPGETPRSRIRMIPLVRGPTDLGHSGKRYESWGVGGISFSLLKKIMNDLSSNDSVTTPQFRLSSASYLQDLARTETRGCWIPVFVERRRGTGFSESKQTRIGEL